MWLSAVSNPGYGLLLHSRVYLINPTNLLLDKLNYVWLLEMFWVSIYLDFEQLATNTHWSHSGILRIRGTRKSIPHPTYLWDTFMTLYYVARGRTLDWKLLSITPRYGVSSTEVRINLIMTSSSPPCDISFRAHYSTWVEQSICVVIEVKDAFDMDSQAKKHSTTLSSVVVPATVAPLNNRMKRCQ